MPSRAAASAVTWAANGVDLREPLKPTAPALFHTITAPSLSVSATSVLLNDVLMWAWPIAMFLRALRRPRPRVPPLRGAGGNYFFLCLPTVFLGPLRVRALVRVRWPSTGSPRRGGRPREEPNSPGRLMFFEGPP